MDQSQKGGVETETAGGITFGTVLFVPDNWAAQRRELNADLMAPTCFEGEFDERAVTVLFEESVVGDGVPGEGGGRANENFKGVGFVQIGFQGSGFLG